MWVGPGAQVMFRSDVPGPGYGRQGVGNFYVRFDKARAAQKIGGIAVKIIAPLKKASSKTDVSEL